MNKIKLLIEYKTPPVNIVGYRGDAVKLIIKNFNTSIEARAFTDGVREACEIMDAKMTDILFEEKRKQWCRANDIPIE